MATLLHLRALAVAGAFVLLRHCCVRRVLPQNISLLRSGSLRGFPVAPAVSGEHAGESIIEGDFARAVRWRWSTVRWITTERCVLSVMRTVVRGA